MTIAQALRKVPRSSWVWTALLVTVGLLVAALRTWPFGSGALALGVWSIFFAALAVIAWQAGVETDDKAHSADLRAAHWTAMLLLVVYILGTLVVVFLVEPSGFPQS